MTTRCLPTSNRLLARSAGKIEHLYGREVSQSVRVLYGGSVSAHNAAAYLNILGIDGLLVGGASLKADEFTSIAEAAFETGKRS